jgi:hypothetical protein
MVSACRLARRRETVSRPPENILSTATAEPGHGISRCCKSSGIIYQEYIKYHEQGKRDLGIELVDPSTTE